MLAPAIAASLNAGLPARTKALWIDGLDVLKNVVQGYGVPIDSLEMTEAAPGQVSSMHFALEDATGVLSVADGALVRFMDVTRGVPLFLGFVSSVAIQAFGIGRTMEIDCVGIETVLDWWQVPAITWPSGTAYADIIAGLVARVRKSGNFPLRVAAEAFGALYSNLTTPSNHAGNGFGVTVTTPAGSLRAALAAVSEAFLAGLDAPGVEYAATVDFYGNLRTVSRGAYAIDPIGYYMTDYVGTVVDGVTFIPADTEYRVDGGSATRAVFVTGSGVSAMVTDGTAATGQVAGITSSATTSDGVRAAAYAYLARNAKTMSGSVTVMDGLNVGSVGSERRAGMRLTITDPNVGLSSAAVLITEISKRFLPSGAEEWRITWGAPARGSMLLRQLTASTTV